MTTDTTAKQRERIEALIRKAERTTNEHEAEAFMAKAEELMIRMGIDRAMLNESEGRSERVIRKLYAFSTEVPQRIRIDLAKVMCWSVLGMYGDNVRTILSTDDRGIPLGVWVLGHESDVDDAMQHMLSIFTQATTGCQRWWRANMHMYWTRGSATPDERAAARGPAQASFFVGYGARVFERLAAIRDRNIVSTTGAELVLVSRANRVQQAMADMFPNTTSVTHRGVRDVNAYAAGDRAGYSADLGQARVTNHTRKEL